MKIGIRKFQVEQTRLNATFSPDGLLSEIYLRTTLPAASTRLRKLLSAEGVDILDAEVASQAA